VRSPLTFRPSMRKASPRRELSESVISSTEPTLERLQFLRWPRVRSLVLSGNDDIVALVTSRIERVYPISPTPADGRFTPNGGFYVDAKHRQQCHISRTVSEGGASSCDLLVQVDVAKAYPAHDVTQLRPAVWLRRLSAELPERHTWLLCQFQRLRIGDDDFRDVSIRLRCDEAPASVQICVRSLLRQTAPHNARFQAGMLWCRGYEEIPEFLLDYVAERLSTDSPLRATSTQLFDGDGSENLLPSSESILHVYSTSNSSSPNRTTRDDAASKRIPPETHDAILARRRAREFARRRPSSATTSAINAPRDAKRDASMGDKHVDLTRYDLPPGPNWNLL
jgi:hypothetical protein